MRRIPRLSNLVGRYLCASEDGGWLLVEEKRADQVGKLNFPSVAAIAMIGQGRMTPIRENGDERTFWVNLVNIMPKHKALAYIVDPGPFSFPVVFIGYH